MTPKEQAAMQQALELLWERGPLFSAAEDKAITALREALAEKAEQAKQEPVAITVLANGLQYGVEFINQVPLGTTLYAAPVRTKDLTDDEINEVLWRGGPFKTVLDATRAVIAADRELNK